MKELPAIVAKTHVGKNVEVKIWRDKKAIIKNVILGRLETSEDFKISEKQKPTNQEDIIESLKIIFLEIKYETITPNEKENTFVR